MNGASKRRTPDAQVRAFERHDLGKDMVASKATTVVRPKSRQWPTSILLDPSTVEKLRVKGRKRGIGYQTMLKIIVSEHLDEY